MAGVGLGPDVLRLLERFDRMSEIPLGIPSVQLQSLDRNGKAHPFLKARRILSSWDALYFRLRANFDMLASDYVPCPPAPVSINGEGIDVASLRAKYEVGKRVVDIQELETGQLLVVYKDRYDGGREEQVTADMVLGADGPNSLVRKRFLGPAQVDRRYAGYVAWRGVVPEEHVSQETRDIFRANITYSILERGAGHVIIYNIPGKDGSVNPGERFLNFCWYTNIPTSSLAAIMTDVDGIHHHTKLAPGKVQPQVWEKQIAYARTIFPPPYLEVIDKISSPFVHLITDYFSPRACFSGGRVLLIGDALTLLRPHVAFSTNQAAYQTLLTEKLIKGEITADQWEYQVITAAYLHWRRSIWFGEFFQRPLYASIGSAVPYWISATSARFKTWMGWLPKQPV